MTLLLLCIAAYLFAGYWFGFGMYRLYRSDSEQSIMAAAGVIAWPIFAVVFVVASYPRVINASYDWLERKMKR